MAKMNTSHRYIFDAAPATLFRGRQLATITATGNSDVVTLDQVLGYWTDTNELADETLAVVINVESFDVSDADETYVLTLEAGPVGFGSAVTIGTITVAATGQHVILVDVPTLKLQGVTLAALRVKATLGGTTPILGYSAFMTQIKA